MKLNKTFWTENDIVEYSKYLKSLSGSDFSCEFEKRTVRTNLKCIAVKAKYLRDIAKEIFAGNYAQFLSYWAWGNHSETIVIGNIINKVKDFSSLKTWLDKYSNMCDNWATCDVVKPKLTRQNKREIYKLAILYTENEKIFVRRIGFRILFNFIDEKIEDILKIIEKHANEKEYYVNMIIAWLLCECFIKQRDATLIYLENNTLNKFIINKTIQKCRDSFRISGIDKQLLLKYKKE